MDKDKKARAVLRASLTKLCKKLEEVVAADEVNLEDVHEIFSLIEEKRESIKILDETIFQLMLEANVSESDLSIENDAKDSYTSKFLKAKYKVTKIISDKESETTVATQKIAEKRKFKLPEIKFICFDGEVKNWLQFWGQFGNKVHNDCSLTNEDKIQYLILATKEGSRAREVVQSFPPVGQNYDKIIECLKNRFGRDDLLVEVYVRELLGLIIKNAVEANKMPLSTLYDKLECQMRALETLGVTSDKCASMLLPMVESCLPEELLRVWQRVAAKRVVIEGKELYDTKAKLEELMKFIRAEVEGEQKIQLAMSGFGSFEVSASQQSNTTSTPSAASLLTAPKQEITGCVFCGGSHKTVNCTKAKVMSMEDKKHKLIENQCCFACFRPKHSAKFCRNKPTCVVCKRRHNVLMCDSVSEAGLRGSDRGSSVQQTASQGSQTTDTLSNLSNVPQVQLQTLMVIIEGNNIRRPARAIIDTASERSYMLKTTLQEMNYNKALRHEKMRHILFGGVSTEEIDHQVFRVHLSSLDEKYRCNFEVLDHADICQIAPIRKGPWIEELKELGIGLYDFNFGPLEVLIGADIVGKLQTGNIIQLKSGLTATETKLGWVLTGRVPKTEQSTSNANMIVSSMLCMTERNISDLWALDVIGIQDPLEQKNKEELHQEAYTHFLDTVKVNGQGRYEVQLPWLEDHPPLPENYELALKCLNSTVRKLKSTNIYSDYNQVFKEWLEEGVIEEVPREELNKPCHYLPHRAVVKDSSLTTRIRPVFNASARSGSNPSLNQCLDMGLNLIELIPSILNRFREEKIGVIADIRRAFLQISLTNKDRDYLRFLWLDNEGNIIVYRHCRVVFGVTCSPFLLSAVIKFHLEQAIEQCERNTTKFSSNIMYKLLKSFYVDNAVTSVNSTMELSQFTEEAITVMNEKKFELRSWEYSGQKADDKNNTLTQVLGMVWDKTADTLGINLDWIKECEVKVVCKREILSIAHRVFDPVGFSCGVALLPKIMLQRIWETKLGWDQEVEEPLKSMFLKWLSDLPNLAQVKIPRWVSGAQEKEGWTLHIFCDASQDAYATAAFLRNETIELTYVQLIQAKSRVAPIGKGKRKVSIPRLELLAACIAARLYHNIVQDFPILQTKTTFWSDSTTVLAWIMRKENVWNNFVTNRVNEIRTLTQEEEWRFVPGTLNPADLPSRGCMASKLVDLKWWEGPEWLKYPYSQWPKNCVNFDEEEINIEKKKTIVSMTVVGRQVELSDWYYQRTSSFRKITERMAYVLRFIRHCKIDNSIRCDSRIITAEEMEASEKRILGMLQKETLNGLEDEKLKTLRPFEDEDGLIRLRTKISNRDDVKDFRYPVVLANANHDLVKSIVLDIHRNLCHAGIQVISASLREKYWLIGGRRALRKILNTCLACKRQNAKPVKVLSPPLPVDRVREAAIFEVVGIDFAGPLYLKTIDGGNCKAWVCLFTCGVYRAVHLELVSSLSTDRFLLAFRRFIGRRGRPSVVYSDNGTNFVGASNELQKIDWEAIQKYSSARKIIWKNNPPTAAWWGGWWERLIGIVKQLLRRTLGTTSLDYEEMLSVLCDCEAVVNNRPLTYISDDPQELQVLTPNLFLQEIKEIGVPDLDHIEEIDLNRRLAYRKQFREILRQRFREEYLGQLAYRQKAMKTRLLKVGEVVIVEVDNKKRLDWPLARVVELLPGQDGEVRLVRLKTAKGLILRPAQRVYPLELHGSEGDEYAEVRNKLQEERTDSRSSTGDPETADSPIITRSGRVSKKVERLGI